MALCDNCGDPDCAAYRPAAKREPWLPGGFELGAQWHSHDSGLTWIRGECHTCHVPGVDRGTMTVVAINRDRDEITVKASP